MSINQVKNVVIPVISTACFVAAAVVTSKVALVALIIIGTLGTLLFIRNMVNTYRAKVIPTKENITSQEVKQEDEPLSLLNPIDQRFNRIEQMKNSPFFNKLSPQTKCIVEKLPFFFTDCIVTIERTRVYCSIALNDEGEVTCIKHKELAFIKQEDLFIKTYNFNPINTELDLEIELSTWFNEAQENQPALVVEDSVKGKMINTIVSELYEYRKNILEGVFPFENEVVSSHVHLLVKTN